MRLVNAETRKLEEFFGTDIPIYATLSHTWGKEEVSFQDMENPEICTKKLGYRKIDYSCTQAIDDGLSYVWIDTCCIDKTSSAETSEAINSMFPWYKKAEVCYAFLEDLPADDGFPLEDSAFSECRWFTRG